MGEEMLKPNQLCDVSIKSGVTKSKIALVQCIVLGLLAGAFIALGAVVAAVASHSITNVGVAKLVAGGVFPVGLILVVICGAELFTGNVLMLVPILDKKIKITSMLRNWVIVFLANLVGAIIIAFLVYSAGTFNFSDGKLGGTVIKVAATKAGLPFWKAFCSGILCNMLVCLAVWGAAAAKDVFGKILIIWFPIMAFVTCGYEHSVANMYYLSAGIFAKGNASYVQASGLAQSKLDLVSISGAIHNLIPVTLGNIVGGGLFVGIAYYLAYKYVPNKSTNITMEAN
jgi:formate transporter